MFNEYGTIDNFPTEVNAAKGKYFKVVKKYLDQMTPVEVRAFQTLITLDLEIAFYLGERQLKAIKAKER